VKRDNCPIPRRNLNNKTSICIEEPPVTEGETYTFVITATNEVGLSSTSKSSNFVVDTTEPDVGEVIASNPLGEKYSFISSSILARWKSFSDKESGILEYIICIGKEPGLCDLKQSISVGTASQYTWYNLSLVNTEEYFVSIKSVNNAGLFTDYTASDQFTVDRTGTCMFYYLDLIM
jgi:predicted RNA-binding protein with TRAM domain